MAEDVQAIIQEISSKTGKPQSEISKLVKAKVEKFSGLLTEQGAVFLVQKELGLGKEALETMQIGQLGEGMKGIEITGKIESIFPVKEFEKNGKKGKLKSFILSDGTGEVRVTLWNEQVEAYNFTRGSEIKVSNVLIGKFNEKKQASLGFNGKIEVLNKKEEEYTTLAELKSGENGVNVAGRIARKFPCKDFESKDRKGRLCSFQITDGTALLRATAWNEKANELEKYEEGSAVEIKNAYTKEGRFGVELHLGYTATVGNPEKEISGMAELLKETMKEKRITDLVSGENAVISGKITEVEKGNFGYDVCNKCGKKISRTQNGVLCENCGETEARKNAVVSVLLQDETGKIRASFFGKNALSVLGLGQEELEKALAEKPSDVLLTEFNGKLAAKPVKLYGYQRTNQFSGANEFMAREIL